MLLPLLPNAVLGSCMCIAAAFSLHCCCLPFLSSCSVGAPGRCPALAQFPLRSGPGLQGAVIVPGSWKDAHTATGTVEGAGGCREQEKWQQWGTAGLKAAPLCPARFSGSTGQIWSRNVADRWLSSKYKIDYTLCKYFPEHVGVWFLLHTPNIKWMWFLTHRWANVYSNQRTSVIFYILHFGQ